MAGLPVPDVVVDHAVAVLLWLCGLCGGLDGLVAVVLALAFALISLGITRCLGTTRWTLLLLATLGAVAVQQARQQAAIPELSVRDYGVYEPIPPDFADMRPPTAGATAGGRGEGWGTVSPRDDGWFQDEFGRTLLLRGVNLAGTTKMPARPDGATFRGIGDPHWSAGHRNVSFVGRPFPLEEADEHLARLRAWGLTFVRFLVTWEAIEHEGPGIYDEVRAHAHVCTCLCECVCLRGPAFACLCACDVCCCRGV
jgi:hypothetical protein